MVRDAGQDTRNRRRLKVLILVRVVVLSVLLAFTYFLSSLNQIFDLPDDIVRLIYAVIIAMYFMSAVYVLLLKKDRYYQLNIYSQLIADIVLVSLLVYLTGSIESNYSLLYTLVIIYSAIFLGRKGTLAIATLSSLSYVMIVELEYFNIASGFYAMGRDTLLRAGDVSLRIAVHVISFYIAAFLASFVVEQEKKARTLLEEKESAFDQLDVLFRSIIESVETGVMTTNLQGRIKTFNKAAQKITGVGLGDVENRPIGEVFPEFGIFFEPGGEISHSREEVTITTGEGLDVHLGCSVSPLKDGQGRHIGFILIFQDLTEIKQMEESLEKSRKLALIGEMAAGLAHEMRNPLASITGSIELLSQGAQLDDTDRQLMQIIMRSKVRLENFVRDFLMLARPLPASRQLVEVAEVAAEVLENIRMSGEWKQGVSLTKNIAALSQIQANREQIVQIIFNLLTNALQAVSDTGNINLEIDREVSENGNNYIMIKVSDDGCGIEEKDMNSILEPFFTNKEKGTGLGLAIVSRIVDGYGGRMKIKSRVGRGTQATVWLPSGQA